MSETHQQEKFEVEATIGRFERAWHLGEKPSIGDYLGVPPAHQPSLIRELVLIDMEFRKRHGESPSLEAYVSQFPILKGADFDSTHANQTTPGRPSREGILPESFTSTEFGRYRILRELGRGGMGMVYLAQDMLLERRVALKTPRFQNDSGETIERFLREARLAATLDHPHICRVYDLGEIQGRHFITMDYVDGSTLAELIEGKPMPESDAMRLVQVLATALAFAHQGGVVHRDLKSSNVMLDREGNPIVMDFGLAIPVKETETRLTRTGVLVGTPPYMSPEQVEGTDEADSPATDIYSLGVILYECLTGRLPFTGSVLQVLRRIATEEPRSPASIGIRIDPRLERLCLEMLAKSPEDRPQSMAEVADRLQSYIEIPYAPDSIDGGQASVILLRKRAFRVASLVFIVGLLGIWFVHAWWRSPVSRQSGLRPATAPVVFSQADAKQLQQDWSAYSGRPIEYVNEIGMKLVLIPAGPAIEPFYIGATEVTQFQYELVMRANPSRFVEANGGRRLTLDSGDFPVERVTIEEAREFCQRLSDTAEAREQGLRYRLPLADEWTFACLAGSEGPYASGAVMQPDAGNYDVGKSIETESSRPILGRTSMVGCYLPNAFGLFDMHGNVSEYCEEPPLLRGGCWDHAVAGLSVNTNYVVSSGSRNERDGFRVVAEWAGDTPAPRRIVPAMEPDGEQTGETHSEWAARIQRNDATRLNCPMSITNSIGMEFRLVPATDDVSAFYLGTAEVTQEEFLRLTGEDPSYYSALRSANRTESRMGGLPVEQVCIGDANRFCALLEGLTDETKAGRRYRLPTVREWAWACSAGRWMKYSTGNTISASDANFNLTSLQQASDVQSILHTVPIRSYAANPWGFFDMHGNVAEICTEPLATCGGGWGDEKWALRLSHFNPISEFTYGSNIGFRVVLQVEALGGEFAARSNGVIRVPEDARPVTDRVDQAERDNSLQTSPTLARPHMSASESLALQARWANHLGLPEELVEAGGARLRLIPPWPGHDPFYLGAHEVTQAEYESLMGENPSAFQAGHDESTLVEGIDTKAFPVEMITLEQAEEFCRRLNTKGDTLFPSGLSVEYRLPTNEEWEFACRSCGSGVYAFGESISDAQANFNGTIPSAYRSPDAKGVFFGRPQTVGSYPPNAFGLYDMHGNISEYVLHPLALKGGSWHHGAAFVSTEHRFDAFPGRASKFDGMRVAAEIHFSESMRGPMGAYASAVEQSLSIRSDEASLPLYGGSASTEDREASQRLWAEYLGESVEIVNSLGMRFRCIPATDKTNAYFLGVHEVTQGDYLTLMGRNPSHFRGAPGEGTGATLPSRLPVESLTLLEARAFCQALSDLEIERDANRFYRLPTNDEWKVAAGALDNLDPDRFAREWIGEANCLMTDLDNTDPSVERFEGTVAVGSFPPNPFGIHDLFGNVSEYCVEPYRIRGGSYDHARADLRVLKSYPGDPRRANQRDGFRVALVIR